MRRNVRARNQQRNKKYSDIDTEKLRKFLIPTIIVLLVLLVLVSIFYYFKNKNEYNNLIETSMQEVEQEQQAQEEAEKAEEENNQETDTTFTLSAVGDIMCHNTQYNDAYNKDTGTYDFSYVFENISSYTKTADICVGNLETTFAGEEKGYSSYPKFNSPDSLAYELKSIGFDVISTAGNHALDTGYDGLSRTIDVLNNADISHLGTYQSQEDQDKVLIKFVKGVKIAFLNYTYETNGIKVPSGKEYCVNIYSEELFQKQLEVAKSKEPDIIIACMHWGTEYQTKQNSNQEEIANYLLQNGVNIVLGTHPHTLQPMEKKTVTLNDGTTQDGFVIYSLGNFIADQSKEYTKDSIILNLTITKHTDGSITIDKYDYVPIYMYKDTSAKTHKFKLVDINKTIYNYENYIDTSIDKKFYNLMKTELNKITKILGT